MSTRKYSLFGFVGFLILVGAMVISGLQPAESKNVTNPGSVIVQNDATNPVPVTDVDAVLPSEIVSLNSFEGFPFNCPQSGKQFREFFQNGGVSSSAFSVPVGQVLVVTSVHVFMTNQAVGVNRSFGIGRQTSGGGGHTVLGATVSIGSNGQGSTSITIPDGMVVPPGTDLCLSPAGVGNTSVTVTGYIAPDN